jgi:Kef-type K+ transport system membrane component KefB
MRREWKQATIVGLVAFAAPFLGCAAVARYVIGWSSDASWLTGIALSTTSVAVVYAVMLEFGFNRTDYGKVVLAACFVNDLATVLMLGLKFSPFGLRTLTFAGGSTLAFFILPWLVPRFFARYGDRPSELEAKLLLLVMFGLGALALWAGSEPVLPAYILGMILASTVGKDHSLVRRLRTLTFGLLTPFYFIRAGSFVSAASLVSGFGVLCLLLGTKMITKFIGVYPVTRAFKAPTREALYTTLLMSTGLTFGSISALFGLTHGIVDQKQYSYLIAAVIGSAIVPTLIANAFFLPRHLLPDRPGENLGRIESVLSTQNRS